jgi:tRNA-uridine 2-sulfurtransferase
LTEQRIIVGLSGGVDSSVCAYLLKQQGLHVEGLFMKNWEEDDSDTHCTAAEDLKDVEKVCEHLDIPLHTVNFATEYWDQVFAQCLEAFRRGDTPNPDVLCNREIKFGVFLQHAQRLGASHIATGHYASIQSSEDGFRLLAGLDAAKDQSYFLYLLQQQQLAKALFPLGDMHKSDVRLVAEKAGLTTFDKKDSTGICFVGERPFKPFLQRYLPTQPGDICTPEGQILGQHDGLMYYTLGQRQGLGIGGTPGHTQPWYVAEKRQADNQLIVVQGHDHPRLFAQSLHATDAHWINPPPPMPFSCQAKIRYRQPPQDCTITADENNSLTVRFEQPQRAVTNGQSVVFYRHRECLGGGIITYAE